MQCQFFRLVTSEAGIVVSFFFFFFPFFSFGMVGAICEKHTIIHMFIIQVKKTTEFVQMYLIA